MLHGHGDFIAAVPWATGLEFRECLSRLRDYLGINRPEPRRAWFTPTTSNEGRDLASIEQRDRVYRDFLRRLTLSEQHRDALRNRGLTDEQITRLTDDYYVRSIEGYAPPIVSELIHDLGEDSVLGARDLSSARTNLAAKTGR